MCARTISPDWGNPGNARRHFVSNLTQRPGLGRAIWWRTMRQSNGETHTQRLSPQMTLDTLPSIKTDYCCLSSFHSQFLCVCTGLSGLIMALLHTSLSQRPLRCWLQCVLGKKKSIATAVRGGCNSEYILCAPPPNNLLPQHVRQIALPLPNLIKPASFSPQTVHVKAHKQPQPTLQ